LFSMNRLRAPMTIKETGRTARKSSIN
jgi:hypothetical protein